MPAKPPPSDVPPAQLVKLALQLARGAPCAKSQRGVVAYQVDDQADHPSVVGTGTNGPPGGLSCDGSEACRESCPKRCVHAEIRALWQAAPLMLPHVSAPYALGHRVHLIHVELSNLPGDEIVACDGPKCWQCSRQLLDVGAAGIWLYEAVVETVEVDDGDGHMDEVLSTRKFWRYYDAETFHRVTSERCKVHH